MDSNQGLGASNANQLNTTGNPQDVGSPVLLPSSGNIQGLAVTSNNLNTSGTTGIHLSNSTQAIFTPDSSTSATQTHKASPLLIVGSILLLLTAIAVFVAVWRGGRTSKSKT
ncbi:MAG TPA: hypothetical protein VLF90_02070 [Patescibacteria group bacterium]|nr:hypothetical protein [Patescibacteria group bacterium]